MIRRPAILATAPAWLLLACVTTLADTIRFKNGSEIQGVVVRQTRTHLHVRYASGLVIQYPKSDIAQIVSARDSAAQAERLLRSGRFGEAIATFQKAAMTRPDPKGKEAIWFGLSRAWLAKGDYAESAMRFITLLREIPGTTKYAYLPLPEGPVRDEQTLMAYLAEAQSDRQAEILVRQTAGLIAAATHAAAGRFAEAEKLWAPAKRHADNRVAELAPLVEAYALCRRRQWADATALLEPALWKHHAPMRPVLFYWLGRATYGGRDYEAAVVALLRVDMMYDPPPVMRGHALLLAGQCFEALRQPDRALAIYDRLRENFGGLQYAKEAASRANALRGP